MAARAMTILLLLSLLTTACADSGASDTQAGAAGPETVKVDLHGTNFTLELAIDNDTRVKGLSHRDHIAPDEGMLFVFPDPMPLSFVMRHCLVPIDIAFLDGAGRVLVVHEMAVEEPQREDESDFAYESRLRPYESRFPAQFALETAGGRLNKLGLKPGDVVRIDVNALKRRAR